MAGARRWKKKAILFKIGTTYGTDSVPTGAANAMMMTDVTFTPLAGTDVTRDLLLPYLGNQGIILAGNYGTLAGSIEMAGSGAAGTPPKWGSLLRACGFAEVLLAATSATYSLVSDSFEFGDLYYNSDGVNHILLGCRGTVQLQVVPKAIPKLVFTLTGLVGTIADVALPTVDVSGFISPLAVSKAVTTMTLHGWAAVAESLNIDLGNVVTPRFLIGDEVVGITDRVTIGTAVVEARSIATVDWFTRAKNRTRGALAVQHGNVAGNIIAIAGPALEIGRPTEGQTDNILNYSLPLGFCPVAGNDELQIVVR